MAVDQGIMPVSGFVAEVDMSGTGFQHRCMKSGTAAGQVNLCAATTDTVVGVLCNRPKAGRAASLAIDGVKKVVAGAAVTRGVSVTTDTTGRAIAAGAAATSFGVALEAAGAAGDLIRVELTIGGKANP